MSLKQDTYSPLTTLERHDIIPLSGKVCRRNNLQPFVRPKSVRVLASARECVRLHPSAQTSMA
jgi:hypothetical protein